ncbi:TonB-dependent receptor plug domain-containing protein [Hymenobacter sp.]|jgi:hypothetical protein|uniref:TonB-dependent receptor plug domain-containing protein n=1 Tax=Hymenobacter sp. TaxID=1898978 RepID=UPI002ED99E9C
MRKLNLRASLLASLLGVAISSKAQGIPRLSDQQSSYSIGEKTVWAGKIITNAPCGVCSLSKNPPSYVVDGVPVSEERFRTLAPEQIQKIDIVKDSKASAMYGPRALNGAVLVTLVK